MASSAVKVAGVTLGSGAILGTSGYGISLALKNRTLRDVFSSENKIALEIENASSLDLAAWNLLLKSYKEETNKNKRFEGLEEIGSISDAEWIQKLQNKCNEILNASFADVSEDNKSKAETWCTRSSSFLENFFIGRPQG